MGRPITTNRVQKCIGIDATLAQRLKDNHVNITWLVNDLIKKHFDNIDNPKIVLPLSFPNEDIDKIVDKI